MRTIIVAALGAFGGTLGYAYILNAPKNTILPASFIGLAGYMAYVLLSMAGFGTMSAYFLSTVLVSVVCELLARKMRTPATIFLLSALVPLVQDITSIWRCSRWWKTAARPPHRRAWLPCRSSRPSPSARR